MTEAEQRAAVLAEARTWLGTPHKHRQACKGAGIDCALFIREAFVGAGLADPFETEFYTHDWHMHQDEERYLNKIEEYMTRLDDSSDSLRLRIKDPYFSMAPGDVIMMKVGQTYSHGVIVTQWPFIIHAYFPEQMVVEESVMGTPMLGVPARLYSYWGTKA